MNSYRLTWRCVLDDGDMAYPEHRNHGLSDGQFDRWQLSPKRDAARLWRATMWAHSAADALTCWEVAAKAVHEHMQHVQLLAVECV